MTEREPAVLAHREAAVTVLTLNRPAKLNAFDQPMLAELCAALTECERDDGCRAIVLTGAGRGFCSGVDLDSVDPQESGPRFRARLRDGAHAVAHRLFTMEKPVIGAVNGAAIGAGFDLALQTDVRVVAGDAVLAASYITVALFPGNGSTYLLPRLVGAERALQLLWTGQRVTGQEAAELGLAWRATAAADVLPTALELATTVADRPPELVRAIKRSVYSGQQMARTDAFAAIASEAALLRDLPEVRSRLGDVVRRRGRAG